MKLRFLFPAAVVFLFLAVFSGASVSQRASVNTSQHLQLFGSGFGRLRHFVASALYLQLDDYHHIAQFQGILWTEVTDYLPQMWLIAKLDPNFTDIYTDAAFHLIINLGEVEKGLEFIREGVANNPDSLDVRYEFAYLLLATGAGDEDEILDEILTYRSLMRKTGGDTEQPYNESSSAVILSEIIDGGADSLNPYSLFYRRRRAFVVAAEIEGLYYPDYLSPPPDYLITEKMDGIQ